MKIVRNLTAMAAVAAALTIGAQARADTIFYLTTPEGGPIGGLAQADAVEVDVAWISTTSATVTFTNYNSGNIGTPAELNVGGEFLASTALAGGFANGHTTCGGNGYGGATTCGGGEGAGYFGTMDIETSGVGAHSFVITLTAEGINTWANSAAVLTPTTGGTPGGFEALVATGENNKQDGGFATPLPATLPLFSAGLGVMGLLGWRKKRKHAAAIVAA
jgi:hypothetical protein